MLEIFKKEKKYLNQSTIKSVFAKIFRKYPNNIFLSSGFINEQDPGRKYSYKEVHKLININISLFKEYNLKIGDRVAVMVGNNPEFFILKFSLNCAGLSCVPINHELSAHEIKYIFLDASPKFIIFSKKYENNIEKCINIMNKVKFGLIRFHNNKLYFLEKCKKKTSKSFKKIKPNSESSILYTSGTTGKPKGCVLTNEYEINAGYSYALKKGLISFKIGREKLYNCLPVHHVNSGVLSIFAMLITANCQIQAERFSVNNFWNDNRLTESTVFHYLGVMVPLLLKNKGAHKVNKRLRIGIGAGIEPSLHDKFEKKFNVLMIELWGMTEMVRCIFDHEKNRKTGKRCFGRVISGLETKVIDQSGNELINSKGSFLIRFNNKTPKKGFFLKYNKNPTATRKAWRGNWFHTGDIAVKDHNGYHYFVDREKNIIRRSGENISSTEVEQSLLNIDMILSCAILPKNHKYYQEEVFAFIVLKHGVKKNKSTAKGILEKLITKLAYFKLPCYIKFINTIPLTSSQKNNRNSLKEKINKYKKNEYFDLEDLKRKLKKASN